MDLSKSKHWCTTVSEASVRIGKGDCEHSKKRGEAVGEEFVGRAADTDTDSGLGKSLDNVLRI